MNIGILDLVVIYAIPFVALGLFLTVFFIVLSVVVKRDIGRLAFSEDLRYNIQLKKRPVGFGSIVQIMLFDSGVQAAFLYRISHFLYHRGFKAPAMVVNKLGKYLTSVDLPPTAKIGPGIVFLHCCNIVFNPYIEVGKHVIIRPWVGLRGYGTVKLEDEVRIGWLSGVMDCVTMGKNSETAPCSIVTQDVPENHVALGAPAKRMLPRKETKLRGVVLELESVLLEPTPLFGAALSEALRTVGKKPAGSGRLTPEDLPPANVISKQLRKRSQDVGQVLEAYLSRVRSGMFSELRLRPNAGELLKKIRERGLQAAVISRQPDVLAREIVDRLGLGESLDRVAGADSFLEEWKPQPWIIYHQMRALKCGVERVIYVAGTPLDVRTGVEGFMRVFWVCPELPDKAPIGGLVTRFPDLAAVLAEFSQPLLPKPIY